MRKICLFVASFVVSGICLWFPAFAADDVEFEHRMETLAEGEDIVGLAMGVVRGGEITMLKTYGVRAIGEEEKIGFGTKFRIASLSKGFAASLFAQLAVEEKLTLENKIVAYAPSFRLRNSGQAGAATIEDVLSHRLGLPPYAYDNLLEAGIDPDTILQRFGEVKQVCRVGQCYAYQNVGFNMIAAAIEASTGQSYEDAMMARIIEPLALSETSLGMAHLKEDDDWARPHRRRRGQNWRVVPVKQPYYSVPAAGGVNATITDMAKWAIVQLGHAPDVLSAEMRAAIHAPRVITPAEKRRLRQMPRVRRADYGLGWRIYDYAGETVVTHAGSVEGYSAQIAILPDLDVGLVILTNSRSNAFWSILPTFLDIELGYDTEKLATNEKG